MIDWLLVALLAIPGFLFQTFLHEASHAVVALRHGLAITSFKFWPHRVDGERFFFGRVTYRHPGLDVSTDTERALRSGAPLISGSFMLAALSMIKLLAGPELDQSTNTVLLICSATVGMDLFRGFLQAVWRTDRGDANKVARYLGIGPKLKVALGVVFAAAVLAMMMMIVGPDLYGSLMGL